MLLLRKERCVSIYHDDFIVALRIITVALEDLSTCKKKKIIKELKKQWIMITDLKYTNEFCFDVRLVEFFKRFSVV